MAVFLQTILIGKILISCQHLLDMSVYTSPGLQGQAQKLIAIFFLTIEHLMDGALSIAHSIQLILSLIGSLFCKLPRK